MSGARSRAVCLMSYGTSLADGWRLAGVCASKILRGAKSADLPIQNAVKVELVTSDALGVLLGELDCQRSMASMRWRARKRSDADGAIAVPAVRKVTIFVSSSKDVAPERGRVQAVLPLLRISSLRQIETAPATFPCSIGFF